jgi:hypothetical protein
MVWKEDTERGSKKRKSSAARDEDGSDDDDDEWEEVEEDSDEDGEGEWEDVESDDNKVEEDGNEDGDESEGEWQDVDSDGDNADDDSEDGDDDEEEVEEEEEYDDDDDENDEDGEEQEVEGEVTEGAEASRKSISSSARPRVKIEAQRLLTSEDFALIAKLKAAQAARAKDPRNRKRVLNEEDNDDGADIMEDGEDGENETSKDILPEFAINPESLGPGMRTKKSTKIERMKNILEGRKERGKFEIGGHGGGLTNKEKERKKNFVMVRKGKRSVAAKVNKSNSDKRYEKMVHVSLYSVFLFFLCACNNSFFMLLQKEQFGRDKRKRRRT